jgi:chromosome segregation ATPase
MATNDDDEDEDQTLRELRLSQLNEAIESTGRDVLANSRRIQEELDLLDEIDEEDIPDFENETIEADPIEIKSIPPNEGGDEIISEGSAIFDNIEQQQQLNTLNEADQQRIREFQNDINEMNDRIELIKLESESFRQTEGGEEIVSEELAKFNTLERQLSALNEVDEERVQELDDEICNTNGKIGAAEGELQRLNKELEKLETVRRTEEKGFGQVTRELSRLTEEIKCSQEELQELRQQLHQLTVERDQFEIQLTEQKALYKDVEIKLHDLQQVLIVLQNDKRLLEQRRNQLIEALKTAETNRDNLKEELGNIDVQRLAIQKKVNSLEQEIHESKKILQEIFKEIEKTHQQMYTTEKELYTQINRLHQLETEKQQVEMDMQRLQSCIQRIEQMAIDVRIIYLMNILISFYFR